MTRSFPNVRLLIGCCLALLAPGMADAAPASGSAPGPVKEKPAGVPMKISEWGSNLDEALLRAASEYRLTLVLFTKPQCTWCERLKAESLSNPDVGELLSYFVLVEVDIEEYPQLAEVYGVRGTPTIMFLASDGRVRLRLDGFVEKGRLIQALNDGLGVKASGPDSEKLHGLVRQLNSQKLPEEKWPDVMLALTSEKSREEIHDAVLQLKPFPKKELVKLLEDRRLVVRLGATDILEEVAGSDQGFDPWLDDVAGNKVALEKWSAWVASAGDSAAPSAVMSQEMVMSYLLDLVSEDRGRAVRASRMLERGGKEMLVTLKSFETEHTGLSQNARNKLREMRYSLMLPGVAGVDPSTQAHRLVFGNTDVRLKSIRDIATLGKRAVPVIRDFLDDRETMVRETAVDAMVAAGGRSVVPALEDLLKREKDTNVVFSVLHALGSVPSKRGLGILCSYLENADEDLVIVSLQSITDLKSKTAGESVGKCLGDSRWRVRVAALQAAGKLQLKELSGKVESMLADPDEFVRAAAVRSLKEVGSADIVKRLEPLFIKEDGLKGSIIEIVRSLNMDIPDGFSKALDGKDSDVLMDVVEKMGSADGRAFPILSKLARHPNADVSSAALAIIGQSGMKEVQYRKLAIETLRGSDRQKSLVLLKSLDLEDDIIKRYNPESRKVDLGSEGGAVKEAPKGEDLFDAFATAPKPAGPKSGKSKGSGDDLFSSFDAKDDSPGDPPALIEAVRNYLGRKDDPELVQEAARLMVKWGYVEGVPILINALPRLTAEQRSDVALSLGRMRRKQALPLFQVFLKDSAEDVRSETSGALLGTGADAACIDLVFSELVKKGSPLKPKDVQGYRLTQLPATVTGKPALRKWVLELLGNPHAETLQTLGLILLEKCWNDGDEPLAEKFIHSTVPWQRRAALYTLGRRSPARFAREINSIVEDPSEHVRLVLPGVYTEGEERWTNYVDENTMESEYNYNYRNELVKPPPLEEPVKAAMMRLTTDKSPVVRFESFRCLLTRFEEVNLADFAAALESLPDQQTALRKVQSFVEKNYKLLGKSFIALLPYLEKSSNERKMAEIYAHFGVSQDEDGEASPAPPSGDRSSQVSTYLKPESQVANASGAARNLKVVFFSKPGCSECLRARTILDGLKESFPGLVVEEHDINLRASTTYNEALSERFSVPETVRLVAPAIFCGGGYLIKNDISMDRLGPMLVRAGDVPLEKWYVVPEKDLQSATQAISERFSTINLGVILLAGALDGINPCAFATIIFFLSYLQIAKKTPRQILQVGIAYIAGIFLAYFLLGLGLVELISRLTVLHWVGQWLNRAMGVFALIVMALSVRDGILCLRGKATEMTLQLPGFIKSAIHGIIRREVRQSRYVIVFFLVGAAIAFLELACTGQVYAPTILFMLKSGNRLAVLYLLLYNIAFIIPLCVVFGLAYFGLKSEALLRFLQARVALLKFSTAILFLCLFLLLFFGHKFL